MLFLLAFGFSVKVKIYQFGHGVRTGCALQRFPVDWVEIHNEKPGLGLGDALGKKRNQHYPAASESLFHRDDYGRS